MSKGRRALAVRQAPNIPEDAVNEYEAERARIIARNKERLHELGVKQAASALQDLCQKPAVYKTCKKRPRPQVR